MRGDNGLFTLKGAEPRKLRSIMLTQFCWDKLQELGAKDGCSRSDLLEKWVADDTASLREEIAKLQAEKQELAIQLAAIKADGHRLLDDLVSEKDTIVEKLKAENKELQVDRDLWKYQYGRMECERSKISQERDDLDFEVNQLHVKNGDLNLELALLKEEKSQTPAQTGDNQLRERLVEIIAKAESADTGYTTKSFSRGLKDLKALL